ncbi:hypothetical protein [Peribacillus kribbensis]|uniref:hypothetical protein n=1 Tax=Peribacillus kribbensis TaxID=356658 RepID=UPI000479A769|nr:hypothetical protein [Peribacillus kribbensis]
MKEATAKVIDTFPVLSDHGVNLNQWGAIGLGKTEAVFLQLAMFFEDPEEHPFDLGSIVHHLDEEWIPLALEVIYLYFLKDTCLLSGNSEVLLNRLEQVNSESC